ncbi:YidB family protein [Psychrobacter sp. UBA3962]|uniref:YidB family protein n=1 Tax=Psychrobacter sp. UBA3962 TaxID=1947352 RepID=UPI0025EA3BDB|nr:YidB family protein [Psychrobacter sp. UBA3962]
MSLLGNLVTQVARQALEGQDTKRSPNQRTQSASTGGLGGILDSILGSNNSAQTNTQSQSNGFGLDDIIGGMLGGQMGGQTSGAGGLGSILGSVLGRGQASARGGSNKAMLVAALMPIALNWIQRNGGLSGALNKVKDMGFGNEAQSWMSTQQQNQNLDPNQINKLFDKQEIEHVCQQTGADETEVRQGLAELLPEIVNQLTPSGDLAKEQEANSEINEILSQISASLPK